MPRRTVTPKEVKFFQENGYIQLDDILTPTQVEKLRGALARIEKKRLDFKNEPGADNEEHKRLFVQKINLWTLDPTIRHHVLNKRLGEIARRLMGAEAAQVWHDHALIKLPGDSKESPWHQDYPYWPMEHPGAISCWLALDDVDENNGSMQFVPKSHTWGTFPAVDLLHGQGLLDHAKEALRVDGFDTVTTRMKAGSCTFHHGLTFHYASANKTDKPRRALITVYMPSGTTYTGAGHIVTDGLGLDPGQPLTGDLFPRVT